MTESGKRKIIVTCVCSLGFLVLALGGAAWRLYYGPLQMTYAAAHGNMRRMETLHLLGVGYNVDGFLVGGPLHCAVANGQVDAMAFLVKEGARIDRLDGYGWTPLHSAVHHTQYEALEWLLAHGADAETRDRDGRTPLELAKQEKADRFIARLRKATGVEQ